MPLDGLRGALNWMDQRQCQVPRISVTEQRLPLSGANAAAPHLYMRTVHEHFLHLQIGLSDLSEVAGLFRPLPRAYLGASKAFFISY